MIALPPPLAERAAPSRVESRAVSFEEVYEAHFAFVWRSARRLGVDEASLDDVTQEIFLVVHRRLPEFEARASMRTWLFAITLRVARDHRRSRRRKGHDPASDGTIEAVAASTEEGPHDRAERAEATRVLHELLDTLDDDKRAVFVLAELEQMAAPDIADAVGVNVNTVYSRLRAARQDFALALSRHHARDRWRLK